MQIKYFRFQCLLLVKKRCKVHQNVVEACVKANVRQIVYTSVLSDSHPLNPSIENIDHSFTEASTVRYFGQEINASTFNLARMNMMLHGVPIEN